MLAELTAYNVLFTVTTGAALLYGCIAAVQTYIGMYRVEQNLRYAAYRHANLCLFAHIHKQASNAQEIVETGVEGTTAVVKALHKGIADIPFTILEAIPVTRGVTKIVHGTHDSISDLVYGSISLSNKTTGKIIRKGLGTTQKKDESKD